MQEALRRIAYFFYPQPSLYAETPKGLDPTTRRLWAESSVEAATVPNEFAYAFGANPNSVDFIVIADKLLEALVCKRIIQLACSEEKRSELANQVRTYSQKKIERHIAFTMDSEASQAYRKDPLLRESYNQAAAEAADLLIHFHSQQISPKAYRHYHGLMKLIDEMALISGQSYNFILYKSALR